MKRRKQQAKEEEWKVAATGGALALQKRTEIEQREVNALVKQRFPRLGTGSSGTYGGSGTKRRHHCWAQHQREPPNLDSQQHTSTDRPLTH